MPQLLLGSLDLMADPFEAELGTSMGQWVALTSTVESLFVDGSVVTGDATGNREVVLRVLVSGDTRAALAQACEALVAEANQAANTLTLVPGDGPSQVYVTFRASTLDRIDDERLGALQRRYELHLPAKPFVRSDVRSYPSAAAPVVAVEDFEGSPVGVAVVSPAVNNGSATYFAAPVASATATPITFNTSSNAAAWPSPSGANVASVQTTYNSQARNVARFTGAGVDFTATSQAWPCGSGDFVTATLGVGLNSGQKATVGVEWLDAAGGSLGIDWGIQITGTVNGHQIYTPWVTSARPDAATQVRVLLTGVLVGDYVDVLSIGVMPAGNSGPLAQNTTAAYQGVYGLSLSPSPPTADVPVNYLGAFFAHGDVAAVDLTGLPTIGVFVRQGANSAAQTLGTDSILRLRLYDAAGNWTQWDLTGDLLAVSSGGGGAFTRCIADVDSPSGSSGVLDLSAVVAWELSFAGGSTTYQVDFIHGGPVPSPTLSTRGTVLTLDVGGSAPSPASAVVSASSGMSNWVLACIDGTRGEPLLSVTSNVATAPAPAGYDHVYQVLGCLAPAVALTSPTCTVVQKINGTAVATRVLTGTTRDGNAYVDFGTVSLPLVGVPDENQGVSYTFTLAPSSSSWVEVLVIDQAAAMVIVDNLATPRKYGFVDEPTPQVDYGMIWVGDLPDRSDARCPLNPPVPGRPIQVRGPITRLLGYSTNGAFDVSLSYWMHYLVEPTQ